MNPWTDSGRQLSLSLASVRLGRPIAEAFFFLTTSGKDAISETPQICKEKNEVVGKLRVAFRDGRKFTCARIGGFEGHS